MSDPQPEQLPGPGDMTPVTGWPACARSPGDTPVTADAVLICSELATNAILHSASSQPGGSFTVRVEVRPGDHTWIEVHDPGSRWLHQPRASGGRGLAMIDALATHWDIRGDDTARVVCARIDWPS
jgi:serine/threonine-protein kinase RsbW